MKFTDAQALMLEISKLNFQPNDWETEFLTSISSKARDLSPKQQYALEKLYEKAAGGGKFQKPQVIAKPR